MSSFLISILVTCLLFIWGLRHGYWKKEKSKIIEFMKTKIFNEITEDLDNRKNEVIEDLETKIKYLQEDLRSVYREVDNCKIEFRDVRKDLVNNITDLKYDFFKIQREFCNIKSISNDIIESLTKDNDKQSEETKESEEPKEVQH